MEQSYRTWVRLLKFLQREPSLHPHPLDFSVAVWLSTLMNTCAPPSLVTYARQLQHQATLQGFERLLRSPYIHHILQAAYHYAYQHTPMQQDQAQPLHPQDLLTLVQDPLAPVWLKALYQLAVLIASRVPDLLGPMLLRLVPAEALKEWLPTAVTPYSGPGAILTIYHHKTSGRGRRAPPLQIPVPPHPIITFLQRRASPTPTRFFPECPSAQFALRLLRRHVPHPHRPLRSYSARIAGMQALGHSLPDATVQQLVGHRRLQTTRS